MKTAQCDVSSEQIARRAYEIWESRGCPVSDGIADWQAAESELMSAKVQRSNSTSERVKSLFERVRQKIAGGLF